MKSLRRTTTTTTTDETWWQKLTWPLARWAKKYNIINIPWYSLDNCLLDVRTIVN